MNESIRLSVPAVWHVSLDMDVDHVWDGFFLYSLLLDHTERGAVLKLATSQAKRLRLALQAHNRRMRGTGQEWSHACELCAWVYVDEHGIKNVFPMFHNAKYFQHLPQGAFAPWSLTVLIRDVRVAVIMIAITLWSPYEINFAPNTTIITTNVP